MILHPNFPPWLDSATEDTEGTLLPYHSVTSCCITDYFLKWAHQRKKQKLGKQLSSKSRITRKYTPLLPVRVKTDHWRWERTKVGGEGVTERADFSLPSCNHGKGCVYREVATVTSLSRVWVRFLLGHRRGNQSDDIKGSHGVDLYDPLELVKWVWPLLGDGSFRNTRPGTVYGRR